MSPRSLVFSSDLEMARRLAQAFQELEMQVEFCNEIFDGIKKLTSHGFDVIVADWDDGVEAGFLLKSARELKSNAAAFMIVVADADGAESAAQAGAHLLFTKPVLPGYAKYALLTSDQFVARMQCWSSPARPSPDTLSEITPIQTQIPAKPPAGVLETILRNAHTAPSPSRRLASANSSAVRSTAALQSSPPHLEIPSFLFAPTPGTSLTWERTRQRFGQFLGGTAIGIALIAGGYVFSKPGAGIPTVSASPRPLASNQPQDHPLLSAQPHFSSDLAKPRVFRPSDDDQDSAKLITVTALRDRTVRFAEAVQRSRESSPLTETESSVSESAGAIVPDSLKTSMDGAQARDDSARSAPTSLLSTVEPVKLNEDLSQEMLMTKVQPSYPETAIRAGLQGAVVLQASIRKDGTIRDLKLIRGPWLLAQAACDAVKQWRYKPYLMNGKLVEAQTYVTVNFKLP